VRTLLTDVPEHLMEPVLVEIHACFDRRADDYETFLPLPVHILQPSFNRTVRVSGDDEDLITLDETPLHDCRPQLSRFFRGHARNKDVATSPQRLENCPLPLGGPFVLALEELNLEGPLRDMLVDHHREA
jgi:hypothetical protein